VTMERFVGPSGKLPILIRDDDTNFFTKPNMLESIYSEAWDQGFKVSLSVVPFQKCIDDIIVPPDMREEGSSHSVADNNKLINFLKSKMQEKSVEILQHGFAHINTDGGRGEFAGNSNLKGITHGKDILREAFGIEPSFFVPPYDDISKTNLKLIVEEGMIPFYRDTNFDKFLRSACIPEFTKRTVFRFVMRVSKNRYLRESSSSFGLRALTPVRIRIENGCITWSLPEIVFAKLTSFDSLLDWTSNIIQYCSKNRTPVCILNHYHFYFHDWNSSITKSELFRTWNKILQSFGNLNFGWNTTFSDLYHRTEKLSKTKIAKTGSKITIESEESLEDFSFRINGRLEPNHTATTDDRTKIITIENLLPRSRVILYQK
jgi:Uncharacterized protein conserved in bacteria (DUF2334)